MFLLKDIDVVGSHRNIEILDCGMDKVKDGSTPDTDDLRILSCSSESASKKRLHFETNLGTHKRSKATNCNKSARAASQSAAWTRRATMIAWQ